MRSLLARTKTASIGVKIATVATACALTILLASVISGNTNNVEAQSLEITPKEPTTTLETSTTTATTTTTVKTSTTPTTSRTTQKPLSTTAKPKAEVKPVAQIVSTTNLTTGLATDSQCASRVKPMRERISSNYAANHNRANTSGRTSGNFGSAALANKYLSRVTGNYAGTTDELIQWASCKWGFDAEAIRALAFVESSWRQAATAGMTDDQSKCPPGVKAPCARAYGILQVRSDYQPGTYPYSANSTAYNLDYGLAYIRTCVDGASWAGSKTNGDLWGCIAFYYSGSWGMQAGIDYAMSVQKAMNEKPWLRW